MNNHAETVDLILDFTKALENKVGKKPPRSTYVARDLNNKPVNLTSGNSRSKGSIQGTFSKDPKFKKVDADSTIDN